MTKKSVPIKDSTCTQCGGMHFGSYNCPYLGLATCKACRETIPEEPGNDWNVHPGRKFDTLGNVYHVKCEFAADSALPSQPAGERLDELRVQALAAIEKRYPARFGAGNEGRPLSPTVAQLATFMAEFAAARSSSPEGEPARAKLLNIAAKVARREYLPSLEKCRTINDARVEVGRYDKHHATLAMDLKAVFDEFRAAAPSGEWIKTEDRELQIG